MPFPDEAYRDNKFQKHVVEQGEFNVGTPEEYEALADAFMSGPKTLTTWECFQKRGQRVRYNEATQELGMVTISTGTLVTYFRPDPLIHRRPSNLHYFRELCQG